MAEEAGREAEVLISIDDANISEIHGADRVIVAKHVELMIVSITPTPEEIVNATEQLKLQPGTLSSDGRPLVFILAGEYKIPVCTAIPTIQQSPREFVFTVPNLWMLVTLPEDCDEETSEAFGMLIKTYGKLDTSQSRGAPAPSQPSGPPLAQGGGGYPAGAVAGSSLPAGYPGAGPVVEEPGSQQSRDLPQGYPGAGGGYGGQEGQPAYGAQPQGYPAGGQGGYPVGAQGGTAGYPAGTVTTQDGAQGPGLSTKIAGGVGFLARGLVKGIHKGRDVAVGGIAKGSTKVREHTSACENPVHVPVEYQAKMAKARATTKSAVVLTGTVTSALVGVSAVLGSGAAGIAGKVIPASVASRAMGGPTNKYVAGVKEVGMSVVGAGAVVFVEATDSARTVLTAGTEGISEVVEHKYGSEVGGMTSDGLGVVTDGVTVASNVRNIGVKAVAKQAAKHAGQQLYDDMDGQYGDGAEQQQQQIAQQPYQQQQQQPQGYPQQSQGYPQQSQGYPQGYPAPQ